MAILLNFLVYLLVFSAAFGMKPAQSLKFVRFKVEQTHAETDTATVQDTALFDDPLQKIEQAQNAIALEKAELQNQKARLTKEKQELETLKREIQKLLADKDKAEEESMYKLAKIYDGMDKEQVARVFDQMDDSLVVAILPKMKPANASQVLEFLSAQRSAKISRMLLVKGI